ncbi:MAG: hypothetical protein F6K41_32655 [Symploca sp. SIO3E6]|nr:hypothetical protein [Caldora sp. SIO3E6]
MGIPTNRILTYPQSRRDRRGDAGTRGRGDAETRRRGDAGTRGRGDAETRRRGDAEKFLS